MELPFVQAPVVAGIGDGDKERSASAEQGQELVLAKGKPPSKAPGRLMKIKGAQVKERKAKGFGGRFREGLGVEALLGEQRCAQGEALLLGFALCRDQHGVVELPLRAKAYGDAALALRIHDSLGPLADRKG